MRDHSAHVHNELEAINAGKCNVVHSKHLTMEGWADPASVSERTSAADEAQRFVSNALRMPDNHGHAMATQQTSTAATIPQ